jgi:DNA-binding transcriptional ArsR family regulator
MQVPEELIPRIVERLAALADESRIRLLLRLKHGQCNVGTLTAEVGISQASVSKHLAVLRRVGLIDVERRGTQAIYRIRDESVFEMCQLVCNGVVRHLEAETAVLAAGKSEQEPQ